ncbi:DUF4829 domain-containing protein [Bacillus sp. ISL-55]|uniref:DUF4829 domain-containing protein n=1 Tax=Bacillus sp. ISL-55 TaxID=2819134 RepID=UPI001BE5BC28|nr:DUF4829 domain-containing protein [Bacillus sp. ISL-55]MBT2695155.1 hypothetical protein [Bacillus sp. ISL-55]
MKTKVFVLILSIYFSIFNLSVNGEKTKMEAPINVIKNYFYYLNKSQWEVAVSRWDKDSRKDLLDFIADKENQMFKRGLLNIKEAHLVMWKELPYEYGKQFLSYRYKEKFKSPKVYYVGVNYKVYSQNKYFIDGVNYFVIAMVLEDGKWKIALTLLVPVSSIISDGYGFGTKDEKTYDERRMQFYNKEIE